MNEITPLVIYFVGILDSVKSSLSTIIFIIGFILFILTVLMAINADNYYYTSHNTKKTNPFKPMIIVTALIFVFTISFNAMIPSSKLAASMIIIPAIANNSNLQSIGSNSLEALRKLTEKWLLSIDKDSKLNSEKSKDIPSQL